MDTYLAFHRDRGEKGATHTESRDKPLPPGHQERFNPTFPSLHDLTTDSQHKPKYHHRSPDNSPYPLGRDEPSDEHLNQIRTANSVTITPELFEKLYLNPQCNVKGDLQAKFGNPTPVALLGFLLSVSPLACELMGWRGAGGAGIATVGAYYFIGGFLMSLGGILEFFLGNTFSFVVFCSYGGFWFTLGATLTPAFNAYGAYSTDVMNDPWQGITSKQFHSSYGFFLLFMGLMSFIYLICSLRTNIMFVVVFAGLTMCFVVLTGSYWQIAQGNDELGTKLQVASGAFALVAGAAGWWVFAAQILESVDFPFVIPVGDISHLITPLSERRAGSGKNQYPA